MAEARKKLAKDTFQHKRLQGKIALVAGATRGAGRGVAIALGEAGRHSVLHRPQHSGRARYSGSS
jgi:NAD(P)-dependent dehydrogenase (short-subunit alcohol dehydrogenase family)